jgi:hypothetical protein
MTTPLVGKRQMKERRSLNPREGAWASRGAPEHLFCPSCAATLPQPFSGSAPLVSHLHGHAPPCRERLRLPARSPFRKGNGSRPRRNRESGGYAPPALRKSKSGMPIALALSARLSVTPVPGNTTMPIGRASSSWSLRLNGAAFLMTCPVRLEDDLGNLALIGPAGGDLLRTPRRAAVEKHHVGVLGHHLVEHGPDALVIVTVDAAGEGDPGAFRQQDLGVRTAPRVDELAAVDHRRTRKRSPTRK